MSETIEPGSDQEADVLAAYTNLLNTAPSVATAMRDRYAGHPTLPRLMDTAARLNVLLSDKFAEVGQRARVEAFGKAYREALPEPPWDSAARLALSVGIGVAADVLNSDYPADMIAPRLVDAGLDGKAADVLTEAELRLVLFGCQLADAIATAKKVARG